MAMTRREFADRFSSGTPYTWRHVVGEATELLEEVLACNAQGIVEEFGDTVMTFQMWLFWQGFDGRLWAPQGVFVKYAKRTGRWRGIFMKRGLEFHLKYLQQGGNPDRPFKRAAAIQYALQEQAH